jgi:hypothetical protein
MADLAGPQRQANNAKLLKRTCQVNITFCIKMGV